MQAQRLTVLGAASLRYAPVVCGGLACYFGELPLEIRFWDPDAERLDLFDRFARYLFVLNKTPHLLISTDDPEEALFGVDRVVVALDEHRDVFESFRPKFPDGSLVLDLREDPTIPIPSEDEIRALPHDIIRFLHGDDYAYDFLREQASSPVKTWLQEGQR